MSRLAYRKDIDGLRALAVLLVLAFHFEVAPISGGYIGVDLFFVISGFLIASIFDQEPTITLASVLRFYQRRVQRLVPAFIVVAFATTLVATVLLLPEDYDAFLKSLRESFLFRSNVFFARATTGYFAANASELPWLHTWSLAVEWQFYFVFPFAVWLVRRVPARTQQNALLAGLVLLGLAWSIANTADHPTQAYFSAPARFFEFLLGALAARFDPLVVSRRFALVVSAICTALLIALAMVFVRETSFPGLNAAAVCVLGFIMIVVGGRGSVLAFDAVAFCGKRSYSIYLWHWPVVAFLHYLQIRPSPLEIVVLVIAIFVASDLTYRWVERPGVAARWRLRTSFVAGCVAPLLVTAGLYLLVERHDGFPQRLGPEATHAYANLKRFDTVQADRCHRFPAGDFESCAFGDVRGHTTALMIGDSHARVFRPYVQVLAEPAHVKVYGVTSSACLALEGVDLPQTFDTRDECRQAIDRDYALLHGMHFDYVVLAERWIAYPVDQLQKLDATLDEIVATGAIPVVFMPIAENGESPKDCFYRHVKLRRPMTQACTIAVDDPFASPAKRYVNALIDAMKKRHPTLRVVDPKAVQCDRGECATVIDATPIYSDTHHLDAFGSTMLGRYYLTRIGNPFVP